MMYCDRLTSIKNIRESNIYKSISKVLQIQLCFLYSMFKLPTSVKTSHNTTSKHTAIKITQTPLPIIFYDFSAAPRPCVRGCDILFYTECCTYSKFIVSNIYNYEIDNYRSHFQRPFIYHVIGDDISMLQTTFEIIFNIWYKLFRNCGKSINGNKENKGQCH
jgi:hypothetical protein